MGSSNSKMSRKKILETGYLNFFFMNNSNTYFADDFIQSEIYSSLYEIS